MAKRAHVLSGDTDPTISDSDISPSKPSKKQKTSKSTVKTEAHRDKSPPAPPPAITKTKNAKKPKFDSASDEENRVVIQRTEDGEGFVDLGKKKRAAVRMFKGNILVDIREFYGSDGDEKPGKKGISLSLEQWQALKDNQSAIDFLFAELKK